MTLLRTKKRKPLLFLVLFGLVFSRLVGQLADSFPRHIGSSTFRDYRVEIYQRKNHLSLKYFSDNSLTQEKEIVIEETVTRDSINIEWTEDTVADNFGELYPRVSLNVSVTTNNGDYIPFFEWQIYDWTKPIG